MPFAFRLALVACSFFAPQLWAATMPASDCAATAGQQDTPTTLEKKLVIIIDDIGHSLTRGNQALGLPGRLTFAVMPNTKYGRQLAEAAHAAGKEVILHAPMSSLNSIPLDRGGLTADMTREEFRDALHAALKQVPHAQGLNNHMGSDLTQRRRQMAWLMQELRALDLYFVDSRTSDKTVAATVATEFNVPTLSRAVFLDHERSPEAIEENYKVLLQRVEDEGTAVAIGHPYAETISFLNDALPLLPHDIALVFVSEALGSQPGC